MGKISNLENMTLVEYLDLKYDSLTKSELIVADLISQGLTNLEVRNKLFVSESTVKGHLTFIYKKLGIRGRAELIKLRYEFKTKGEYE